MATGADPGLFGPYSVTWQLHADPMMWVAGIRALYLQALHPLAVRAVLENSDFRRDAWGRLMRTAGFVGTTTYGTADAAGQAGRRVRALHARLRATDPATGAPYRIDQPELLLWVHCAEIDSYLQVVRRSGFPLDDRAADRYIAEHRAVSAPLVGLDPALVPADRAALAAYFARARPELAAGADAREVDDFLRRPPVPTPLLPARTLLWGPVTHLAYDALPEWAHPLYGRPAPRPAQVTRRLRATGAVLRTLPGRVRWQLPPKHILRAMDRLGPGSRPAPWKANRAAARTDRAAAILDGPGAGAAR
ncbi:oxygenase MpaB family protein [Streptomyces sp. NPDC058045]|uniref:oxygenase MpaB family protein n=1 Tax=Streptomyces sp. NPDC058045 TaxID=3346311 RepID=UPI0036E88A8B